MAKSTYQNGYNGIIDNKQWVSSVAGAPKDAPFHLPKKTLPVKSKEEINKMPPQAQQYYKGKAKQGTQKTPTAIKQKLPTTTPTLTQKPVRAPIQQVQTAPVQQIQDDQYKLFETPEKLSTIQIKEQNRDYIENELSKKRKELEEQADRNKMYLQKLAISTRGTRDASNYGDSRTMIEAKKLEIDRELEDTLNNYRNQLEQQAVDNYEDTYNKQFTQDLQKFQANQGIYKARQELQQQQAETLKAEDKRKSEITGTYYYNGQQVLDQEGKPINTKGFYETQEAINSLNEAQLDRVLKELEIETEGLSIQEKVYDMHQKAVDKIGEETRIQHRLEITQDESGENIYNYVPVLDQEGNTLPYYDYEKEMRLQKDSELDIIKEEFDQMDIQNQREIQRYNAETSRISAKASERKSLTSTSTNYTTRKNNEVQNDGGVLFKTPAKGRTQCGEYVNDAIEKVGEYGDTLESKLKNTYIYADGQANQVPLTGGTFVMGGGVKLPNGELTGHTGVVNAVRDDGIVISDSNRFGKGGFRDQVLIEFGSDEYNKILGFGMGITKKKEEKKKETKVEKKESKTKLTKKERAITGKMYFEDLSEEEKDKLYEDKWGSSGDTASGISINDLEE